MKIFNYLFIILSALTLFAASGCSCSSHDSDVPAADITEVSPEIKAAAIAAADSVIALGNDETALNEKLLDVRASIYSLSVSRGEKAGKDFEFVFRHHITENCDSLARILF
ncbi:MAG: hypothetical protein K2L14_04910 [Duncaniella sp.]|nr:hypothetical protein [Duncaniella sp.]